jgi:hypothetical protein
MDTVRRLNGAELVGVVGAIRPRTGSLDPAITCHLSCPCTDNCLTDYPPCLSAANQCPTQILCPVG